MSNRRVVRQRLSAVTNYEDSFQGSLILSGLYADQCTVTGTLSSGVAHRRVGQGGLVRLIAAGSKRRIFAVRGVCKPMILLDQIVSRSRLTA